ncbi:uncharacterized protein [Palaemon carinicauda]|uniref:uncharacterized protein isoform X2 n=1 Tax=Palaemon carinicauda TaxID=392227 RepID=UPI0035B691BB
MVLTDVGTPEDQGLTELESSMQTLSVYDTKRGLSDLENAISKVSLKESEEDHSSENEEAETGSKEETPSEIPYTSTSGSETESVSDVHSEKDDDDVAPHSSDKDDAGYGTETETETEKEEEEGDEKEDSLSTEEVKEKKSLDEKKSSDEAVDDGKAYVEDTTDKKEKKDDGKPEGKEEKKSTKNALEKKSSGDSPPEEAAPTGKKLLPRGLGAGTSDQQYPYPYLQEFEFSCGDVPSVPTGPFSQTMSPQYAMSPTYMGMAVSPMSGYNEPSLLSPMNGMSSMDGMCNINFSQYMLPESPNSMQDDCDLGQSSPLTLDMEMHSSPFPSPEVVSEVIAKVLNSPNTTVPEDKVLPIRKSLEKSLEGVMPDNCDLGQPSPLTRETHFPSPEDVLEVMEQLHEEAIAKVLNSPNTTVPEDKVLPIAKSLEESLEGVMPDYSCDSCDDVNIATYFENGVQNGIDFFNYPPAEPTPPLLDFDISGREAGKEIHKFLNEKLYEKASKKMAKISNEELTQKDKEGDNPCMVVACQQEDSDRFRENLCAMVNRAKTIKMCCEHPINNKTPIKRCMICGNSNEQTFYSPFAMVNNQGDTLLSSVLKVNHSQLVVNFICETIYQNPSDIERIFNHQTLDFYRHFKQSYPVLGVFIPDY